MELNEILKIALKGGASDIHLKSGLPPMFRVDGALVPLKNGERLNSEDIQNMSMMIMNPLQKQRFEESRAHHLAAPRAEVFTVGGGEPTPPPTGVAPGAPHRGHRVVEGAARPLRRRTRRQVMPRLTSR